MPKKKKGELPSGNIRRLIFVGYENRVDENGKPLYDESGKPLRKRIYESVTGQSKTEVDLAAAQVRTHRSRYTGSAANMTYGQALDAYIALRSSVLSPGTLREYKNSRNRDLQELIDIRLADLTQEIIDRAINRAAATHSPKTVHNIHGLLSAVLKQFRPDFALRTRLPLKVRPTLHIPDDNDIQCILDIISDDEMRLAVLLAAFGPLRRSEICGLRFEDLDKNVLHISRAMIKNADNEWVIKNVTKTAAGNRFIQLPDFVCDLFRASAGPRPVNLNPNQISRRFKRLCARSGLQCRFHDLRHYCASMLHALGIPDAYIMERGGWESDAVLKNVYRHTLDKNQKEMNGLANEHFSRVANRVVNSL